MSVSAFGVTIALKSDAPWALHVQSAVRIAAPYVESAAETVNAKAIQPAFAWTMHTGRQAWEYAAEQTRQVFAETPAPKKVAATEKPAAPSQKKVVAVEKPAAPPRVAAPAPSAPPVEPPKKVAALPPKPAGIAPPEPAPPPLLPAPDASPPGPGEVARVLAHLKVSLTHALYDNFDLFLYISKADHGPWHQRMFVFKKEASGNLDMLYSFPVSTGREVAMLGPSGKMYRTNTPPGYYQLDPKRTYRRYHSHQWDHAMPYAMFFNWEHDGLKTGLAIHAATGADIKLLGTRASAGCVRLDPRNAHLLFNLIRKHYRGLAPRFAFNRRTATMANDGLLMHDKAGHLEYTEGYKVLVLIENKGGDDVIAALF